ncbi:MAG: phospholipase effector Tle1 domain-containing protein [Alcaligenes sp.]
MSAARLRWFIFLPALLPAAAWPQAGRTCSLPPTAPSCAPAAELAGEPEPAPDLGLLNPVDLLTGRKQQSDTDLPASRAWPLLQLQRHMNGDTPNPTPTLGPTGWALNYDLQVRSQGAALHLPDGRRLTLSPPARPEAGGWRWQGADGLMLHFNEQGWLTRLRTSARRWLHIERLPADRPDAHAVRQVRNHLGQVLRLDWQADRQALAVQTPAGLFRWRMTGQGGRPWLASVSRPDGLMRLYHAAPAPWSRRLGGVSLQAPGQPAHRLQQWDYDEQGRVRRIVSHALDQEWTASHEPGLSLWTQGQEQHRFAYSLIQGQARLDSLESRWCDGCPAYRTVWRHDAQGRWLQAGPWHAQRRADGSIRRLRQADGGWGPMTLDLDERGRLQGWDTLLTGPQTRRWNTDGTLAEVRHVGADGLLMQHDASGRLASLHHRRGQESELTRLRWLGHGLLRIEHPEETQRLKLRAGLLRERRLERRHSPGQAWTERFDYDDSQRLVRHHLPEGGRLDYRWDAQGRLAALDWTDAQGRLHSVVQARDPGYAWGNGLHLISRADATRHSVDLMLLRPDGSPVWTSARRLDAQGRVRAERHHYAALGQERTWRLDYDGAGRLAAYRQEGEQNVHWLAWEGTGALRARHPRPAPAMVRAPDGLPTRVGELDLDYGPSRRLRAVRSPAGILVQYRHDAFGQRILRIQGDRQRAFFHHGQQLLAELDLPATAQRIVSRRYLYAGLTPVGLIIYDEHGQGRLHYLHSDLMGAVRLATDEQGRTVWAADLDPLGQARILLEELELHLRLPGQYADPATGWHDNLLRTYSPRHGHYLEPDPLGPWPGSQALGYAGQQPLRRVDPLGLLLFAFDGTRQSRVTRSNVWKLAQLYREGAAHYHDGPGNPHSLDADALTAWRAGRILQTQWTRLLDSLQQAGPGPAATPVDLLGFSRGAALARDFANRILDHTQAGWFLLDDPLRGRIRACITPRFLGLFDTVAQFGLSGTHNSRYRLGVPEAWQWVAHAVSLHEHRHLFPLSALAQAMNVVEMPFIGAHSDIGGGVLPADPAPQPGDLDKVALAWMHWQARAAGLTLAQLPLTDLSVAHPILHDMRPAWQRSIQNGDRQVNYHGHGRDHAYQEQHPKLGAAMRRSVQALIRRHEDWRSREGHDAGVVDMKAYDAWLKDHLGWDREAY